MGNRWVLLLLGPKVIRVESLEQLCANRMMKNSERIHFGSVEEQERKRKDGGARLVENNEAKTRSEKGLSLEEIGE